MSRGLTVLSSGKEGRRESLKRKDEREEMLRN